VEREEVEGVGFRWWILGGTVRCEAMLRRISLGRMSDMADTKSRVVVRGVSTVSSGKSARLGRVVWGFVSRLVELI
jgi:hypothetical protein